MCVVTSDVADSLRVVRLLWAGRNPFHEQEEGNIASTNRTASIDDDATSHDRTQREVNNNNVYGKICADRADGHHNCADIKSNNSVHGHSSRGERLMIKTTVMLPQLNLEDVHSFESDDESEGECVWNDTPYSVPVSFLVR